MGKSKKKTKKQKFVLKLSVKELTHLRNIFSVGLPPDLEETFTAAVASFNESLNVDKKLWKKIANACEKANLPMGDSAPDFVISIAESAPALKIFQVGDSGEETESENQESGNIGTVLEKLAER